MRQPLLKPRVAFSVFLQEKNKMIASGSITDGLVYSSIALLSSSKGGSNSSKKINKYG